MNNVKKAPLLLGAGIVLLVLFTLARTVREEAGSERSSEEERR